MTDLQFQALGARAAANAASPTMLCRLRITDAGGERIHSISLHVHAQIEPRTRPYTAEEQARLYELFGEPPQWSQSLRPVPWARVTTFVPAFTSAVEVDVGLPCTYDFEVGATKYLHALREGEVMIRLLFSGTIFVSRQGGFHVEQVPWDREALCRVPARLWTEVMDQHFPGCGWIRLRRETLDALVAFKGRQALITWDDTIGRLLAAAAVKEPA